jgi:hypothetical protein
LAVWAARAGGGVEIATKHAVAHVAWHGRGDYFSSVAPGGATQARFCVYLLCVFLGGARLKVGF